MVTGGKPGIWGTFNIPGVWKGGWQPTGAGAASEVSEGGGACTEEVQVWRWVGMGWGGNTFSRGCRVYFDVVVIAS